MSKQCFIDVETTGVDPVVNGIIQIAGIIVIDGEEVDTFDSNVRPFDADEIEQSALDVSGTTHADLEGYPTPAGVWKELTRRLSRHVDKFDRSDKFHFIGYNAKFDSDFMRAWFEKCGDRYYGSMFWFPSIDVATIAGVHLMDKRHELVNFKLGTVAKYFNISFDGALHDAMVDIRITMELFSLLQGVGDE